MRHKSLICNKRLQSYGVHKRLSVICLVQAMLLCSLLPRQAVNSQKTVYQILLYSLLYSLVLPSICKVLSLSRQMVMYEMRTVLCNDSLSANLIRMRPCPRPPDMRSDRRRETRIERPRAVSPLLKYHGRARTSDTWSYPDNRLQGHKKNIASANPANNHSGRADIPRSVSQFCFTSNTHFDAASSGRFSH